MLDNLLGPEDIASADLVKDLRSLCSLQPEEIIQIAEAFADLSLDLTERSARAALATKLRSVQMDSDKLGSALKVSLYVSQQWAKRRLTKEQIVSDFKSLELSDDSIKNVTPLLNAIHSKLSVVQRRMAENSALSIGTPRIKNAMCALDARAVFKSQEYDKLSDGQQPYYDLDFFVPVVVLELVCELNSDKTTHAFLLTERELDQLLDILSRAKSRLASVRNGVKATSTQESPRNE